ncbi:hypothetical protein QEN19_003627 [Hanseniaspora menglaensis]
MYIDNKNSDNDILVNSNKSIKDVELPDYVPRLPPDFTFKKTNLYQIPSFVNGTSNNINTLNDSDNLFNLECKLEKVLQKASQPENINHNETSLSSIKGSIIPNKSIYLNYHSTPNNEYFIRNLPNFDVSLFQKTGHKDILSILQRRNTQLLNKEAKQNKLRNNWKRNVFNNISSLAGNNAFDIKLADDKFSKENYKKMEKVKLKKINKFKENEFAWQKMKMEIYARLREEEHLLNQLEVEERRLREMNELKARQVYEELQREKEIQEVQPKMVFKLSNSTKSVNEQSNSNANVLEDQSNEYWVTLKYNKESEL